MFVICILHAHKKAQFLELSQKRKINDVKCIYYGLGRRTLFSGTPKSSTCPYISQQ